MKNKLYAMTLTILTLFFATFAYCFAQAGNYNGICVHVLDGDTVDVVDDGQNLHRIQWKKSPDHSRGILFYDDKKYLLFSPRPWTSKKPLSNISLAIK